jgi:hypothetical protein
MAGFGTDPAGYNPAGLDLPATTEQRVAATPVALAFDGLNKDFILDANGRYVEAHPVDAKVFNRLRIRKTSIRSASATGNNIANRKYIDPDTIEAEIRDEVSVTLADMVAAGDIADRGLEIDLAIKGRIQYRYCYVNLHTGRRESVPLS